MTCCFTAPEKASPLSPTICSVERLVKSSEPAITGNVRVRPPRKNPSFVLRLSLRVKMIVRIPTSAVKARNVTGVTQSIAAAMTGIDDATLKFIATTSLFFTSGLYQHPKLTTCYASRSASPLETARKHGGIPSKSRLKLA